MEFSHGVFRAQSYDDYCHLVVLGYHLTLSFFSMWIKHCPWKVPLLFEVADLSDC